MPSDVENNEGGGKDNKENTGDDNKEKSSTSGGGNSLRAKLDKFKKYRLLEKSSAAADKTNKEKGGEEPKTERSVRQRRKKKEKEEEESRHKGEDAVPEPNDKSHRHRKQHRKKEGEDGGGEDKSAGEPYTAREKKVRKKNSAEKESSNKTVREKGGEGGKTVREKTGSGKTVREKRRNEETGGAESKRERRKKKLKKEDEEAAPKIHYVVEDTEAEKKAKDDAGPICTDAFGYGVGFPNWMLEVPRTITHEVKPPAKLPMVKVFRTMVVYDVPPELREHIDIGDIICNFNDQAVTTRDEYTKLLAATLKISEPHTIRYTFYRTLRTRKIAPENIEVEVPAGFEILCDSFDYLYAYLTFVPKSQIGMNIKTYNGKVFVSAIDNGQAAIARKSLLVGDAILCIDDNIVSGVKMTEDALAQACSKRKYCKLLIERARTMSGVRQVKLALCTEKTVEINPRMGEDIVDLCTEQLKNMDLSAEPSKSIYRPKPSKASKKDQHVNVADESVETPISTDVNNVTLLATTPPVPCAKPINEYDGRGGYVQGTPAQVRQIQLAQQQHRQRCRTK